MPGIDCFNTSHSTSPYNSPFTWVLAIKMVTQRPEGRLLPRCCIFFPTQNGSTPPSTEPVPCLSISQPDLQILAPLSVQCMASAGLYSTTCIFLHIKIRHYMKGRERQPISKHLADLHWQPAKPLLNLPVFRACSLPTNTMLPWQLHRQPASQNRHSDFRVQKIQYCRGSHRRETLHAPRCILLFIFKNHICACETGTGIPHFPSKCFFMHN